MAPSNPENGMISGAAMVETKSANCEKGCSATRPKHRATGRPRGRPPSVPFDLDMKIYDVLRRKMNPDTHMVRPRWKELARELAVSRSTISRVMPSLKSAGLIESVLMTSSKNERFKYILYKVNDWGNVK